MFCGNCGTQLPDDAQFCGNCGTRTGAAAQGQEASSSQQTAAGAQYTPPPAGYFISINHQESGPYTAGQIQTMIQNGQVTLNHWTRRETSSAWIKIDQTPEFGAYFANQQPPPQFAKSFDPTRKLRHGFTTFWLFLLLIVHILAVLVLVVEFLMPEVQAVIRLSYPHITDSTMWAMRIGVLVYLYALIKLMGFSKFGFWLYLGTGVALAVLLSTSPEDVFANIVTTSAIPIGILFGVLQFKNAYNARSTWDQLD